jgi:hypothetical protein
MPTPTDRPVHILEQNSPELPLPPLNLSCSSGFEKQTLDIRWTLPSDISANTKFNIIGVNIYRSFDSEFGPFYRLNTTPIGSTFFRDKTRTVLALQEDVSRSFVVRGDTDPDGKWVFCVQNRPIVIHSTPGVPEITNLNVYVTVNGVPAFVEHINSPTGEVELRNYASFDVASQKFVPPVLPTSSSDVVLATYRYTANEVVTSLASRVFYRIATVAMDSCTGQLHETPLDRASQTNNNEIEKLDWIWREAVRRNRFLLIQGGERVKVFIRKVVGPKCGCYSESNKQPSNDCLVCFGTGVLGGYDGPYDIILAPDDGEKSITQSNRGRTLAHPYDTWTSPSPQLSQRDFIVKLNGDRYGVGPVRSPSNRGMQLQQFFSISHLDEGDVRYKVSVIDAARLSAPQTRYIVPGKGGSTPMMTEREVIPDERETRGSTVVFENTHRR